MSNLPKARHAQRVQLKASIVIEGLSGSGKSGLALMIANALSDKGYDGIYAVDTECKSLDLFEGTTMSDGSKVTPFLKVDLNSDVGYSPSNFLELREDAISSGAQVFIQDSTSHAWVGEGGVLEMVNKLENSENAKKLNKFNAWGVPEVVSEKNNLVYMIRDPRIHVISTVRLKEKFDLIPGEGVKSRGEAQIMQADMKYEPDLLLRCVTPGDAEHAPVVRVMKSRYAFLRVNQEYAVDKTMLDNLKAYLAEGASPDAIAAEMHEGLVQSCKDILNAMPTGKAVYSMFLNQNKLDSKAKLDTLTDVQLNMLYNRISKM